MKIWEMAKNLQLSVDFMIGGGFRIDLKLKTPF